MQTCLLLPPSQIQTFYHSSSVSYVSCSLLRDIDLAGLRGRSLSWGEHAAYWTREACRCRRVWIRQGLGSHSMMRHWKTSHDLRVGQSGRFQSHSEVVGHSAKHDGPPAGCLYLSLPVFHDGYPFLDDHTSPCRLLYQTVNIWRWVME